MEKKKAKVVQVYFSDNHPLQEKLFAKIKSGEAVQLNETRFANNSNMLLELALLGMVTLEETYPHQFDKVEVKERAFDPIDFQAGV